MGDIFTKYQKLADAATLATTNSMKFHLHGLVDAGLITTSDPLNSKYVAYYISIKPKNDFQRVECLKEIIGLHKGIFDSTNLRGSRFLELFSELKEVDKYGRIRKLDIVDMDYMGELRDNRFLSHKDNPIMKEYEEPKEEVWKLLISATENYPARDIIIRAHLCRSCFQPITRSGKVEILTMYVHLDQKTENEGLYFLNTKHNLSLDADNMYFEEPVKFLDHEFWCLKFLNGYYHQTCYERKSLDIQPDFHPLDGSLDGSDIKDFQIMHVHQLYRMLSDSYGLDEQQVIHSLLGTKPYFRCAMCSLIIDTTALLISDGMESEAIDRQYTKLPLEEDLKFQSLFCSLYQSDTLLYINTVSPFITTNNSDFEPLHLYHPWCQPSERRKTT